MKPITGAKPFVRLYFAAFTLGLFALMAITACLFKGSLLAPLMLTQLDSVNLPPALFSPHILGTDALGRDLLCLLVAGAFGTLTVAFGAALSASFIGYLWGSLSALCGGFVDNLMMRIVDGLLSIPSIILLLVLTSILTSPEFTSRLPSFITGPLGVTSYSSGYLPMALVIAALSATAWLESARVARSRVDTIMQEEYFTAAKALGATVPHLLVRHLAPALTSLALLEATLLTADAIILESGLSFLGLGLGPSTPSWGTMLRDAQPGLLSGNYFAALLPGLFIALTVVSIHFTAEAYVQHNSYKER